MHKNVSEMPGDRWSQSCLCQLMETGHVKHDIFLVNLMICKCSAQLCDYGTPHSICMCSDIKKTIVIICINALQSNFKCLYSLTEIKGTHGNSSYQAQSNQISFSNIMCPYLKTEQKSLWKVEAIFSFYFLLISYMSTLFKLGEKRALHYYC